MCGWTSSSFFCFPFFSLKIRFSAVCELQNCHRPSTLLCFAFCAPLPIHCWLQFIFIAIVSGRLSHSRLLASTSYSIFVCGIVCDDLTSIVTHTVRETQNCLQCIFFFFNFSFPFFLFICHNDLCSFVVKTHIISNVSATMFDWIDLFFTIKWKTIHLKWIFKSLGQFISWKTWVTAQIWIYIWRAAVIYRLRTNTCSEWTMTGLFLSWHIHLIEAHTKCDCVVLKKQSDYHW